MQETLEEMQRCEVIGMLWLMMESLKMKDIRLLILIMHQLNPEIFSNVNQITMH